MSTKYFVFASPLVLAIAVWLLPKAPVGAQDAPGGQDQEVLTHGPVHEAFAEPTVANPTATLVVPKQPPAPIEEMPPDVKPDGANVVWISGYYAWDDTRNDFIWVSGIWRDTPPNYVWVAGYWNQVAGGAQWTPGFWSPAEQQQVNYLPEPPQSVETGPNTPAPSADDFWVPGNYQYVETRYVWRPGYWTVAQPDWIWTPAHYVWTPSGYIFIPGHWDYVLARRGVLFAPVYFAAPIYARRHFVFAPSVVIDCNLLTVNFFVRPNYCHYYFGDCYGDSFVALGFSPWFSVGFGRDPLFAYYRWEHREDRHWSEGVHEHFAHMNTHPEDRPPRTFVQQTTIVNNNIVNNNITINKNSNNKNIQIGAPLNQYVKNVNASGGNNVKFVNVSTQQRDQIAQQAVKSQDIGRERAKFEASPGGSRTGAVTGGPNLGGTPKTLNLRTLAQSSGGQLPGTTSAGSANVNANSNTQFGGPGPTGGPSTGRTGTGFPPGNVLSGTGTGNSKPGATGSGTTGGPVTGRGPTGITGPGTTGSGTTSGPLIGRGPTGIAGPGTTGSGTTSGPLTGRGPTGGNGSGTAGSGATGGHPTTGTGSDLFRPRTGDAIKSGSTGPGASGSGSTGPSSTGKSIESFKGPSFSPSGGRPSGPPPTPAPSDKGGRAPSGDSRGKKPDDKGGPNDPRGGRALFNPGNSGGLANSQGQNPLNEPADSRVKDPIRPLTLNPALNSAARGSSGPVSSREANDFASQVRAKDPVRPLTLIPQSPQPQSRATGSSNGPALRTSAEPKAKDPIQPLRLSPNG